MAGIREELMFRGILFHGASSSFGIWRAAWITSIIFGARHALNGFINGNFNASILQAFCAFMFGFYMVALRVRLDTIIPGIIIH
jgi:membrane protease YdiL (CAAX protease family)